MCSSQRACHVPSARIRATILRSRKFSRDPIFIDGQSKKLLHPQYPFVWLCHLRTRPTVTKEATIDCTQRHTSRQLSSIKHTYSMTTTPSSNHTHAVCKIAHGEFYFVFVVRESTAKSESIENFRRYDMFHLLQFCYCKQAVSRANTQIGTCPLPCIHL